MPSLFHRELEVFAAVLQAEPCLANARRFFGSSLSWRDRIAFNACRRCSRPHEEAGAFFAKSARRSAHGPGRFLRKTDPQGRRRRACHRKKPVTASVVTNFSNKSGKAACGVVFMAEQEEPVRPPRGLESHQARHGQPGRWSRVSRRKRQAAGSLWTIPTLPRFSMRARPRPAGLSLSWKLVRGVRLTEFL